MSWIITFAILFLVFLFCYLIGAFFEGVFEWEYPAIGFETGEPKRSWKAYFSLAVIIAMLIGIVYLIHHGIVTRHLFGV